MRFYDIIAKKRDGMELTEEEMRYFIRCATDPSTPDYEISAMLMAMFINGLSKNETVIMTDAMAHSGDMIPTDKLGDLSVDKHSTGGVGDKTTLIVAPIAAAMGCKIGKMSGRGLGHTGGTVDKLESIPGYKTSLSPEDFFSLSNNVGLCVTGQSGNMAPADKRLYALRDVTATVNSIPLITSSIMSKKLAAGSKSIVLDVKCGSGAFMKSFPDAKALADNMVKIGKACGRNISALITNMDEPLGYAVGNTLEIIEAVAVLRGKVHGDIREISISLAAEMASLALSIPIETARTKAVETLDSGAAFAKMKEWISAQGGDASYIKDTEKFPKASVTCDVTASEYGYISEINAEQIGVAALCLGAGRERKEDVIDHSAGVILHRKIGDFTKKGDVLFTLYTNKADAVKDAENLLLSAVRFSESRPEKLPLIYETVR